jgi:hypothetical protein
MHAFPGRRHGVTPFLTVTAIALGLVMPTVADAARPKQVSPKPGKALAVGSQPTFKVRDGSAAARQYTVYITISTTKKRKANGDLKRTSVGTFASMKRKGSIHRYKAPFYTFPTWYMQAPDTYYWQAYRIDCSTGNKSCHVHSKIRSFKVR